MIFKDLRNQFNIFVSDDDYRHLNAPAFSEERDGGVTVFYERISNYSLGNAFSITQDELAEFIEEQKQKSKVFTLPTTKYGLQIQFCIDCYKISIFDPAITELTISEKHFNLIFFGDDNETGPDDISVIGSLLARIIKDKQ